MEDSIQKRDGVFVRRDGRDFVAEYDGGLHKVERQSVEDAITHFRFQFGGDVEIWVRADDCC